MIDSHSCIDKSGEEYWTTLQMCNTKWLESLQNFSKKLHNSQIIRSNPCSGWAFCYS